MDQLKVLELGTSTKIVSEQISHCEHGRAESNQKLQKAMVKHHADNDYHPCWSKQSPEP